MTAGDGLVTRLWYGDSPWVWLLAPFSALFAAASAVRRLLYRRGVWRAVDVGRPVVVVGNVSVGGTGKTPVTLWLAQQLKARGRRPGIVSRGYRGRLGPRPVHVRTDSDPAVVGDEPLLMERRRVCPVVVHPDRVAAARMLVDMDCDVIVADDGLQHYRLARRFEIAVVDGVRGMGNGLCLPAGPLREPPERLQDVDAIVVNGGDWGHAGVFRATPVVTRVRQITRGAERPLESFAQQTVHAVAGIGHPQRFFDLLEDAGLEVVPHPLDDHAELTAEMLRFDEPGPVLVTEKDAVKCAQIAHDDVWAVCIDLTFPADAAARLLRLLLRDLQARPA